MQKLAYGKERRKKKLIVYVGEMNYLRK